jgi:oxygen-independent coproporphyrinogen-3 oxidase
MMDFGVYIHVPFCRVQCPYCTFYTVLKPQTVSPMQRFLQALDHEWRQRVSPRLQRGDRLRTLYFGGGTPSDLPAQDLSRQLAVWRDELRQYGVADLAALDEVTVECNPESATGELLDALQRAGVHRVSLGVQALVDQDLQTLGRGADAATVRRSLRAVSQRFTNWNADWIVGVPHSNWQRLREGLEALLPFAPPHLSFYCLEMPPAQAIQLGDIPGAASDAYKADLYLHTSAWVENHGYEHYEISNAARPGFRALHNQAYWEGRDYIGLGPGAHSLEDGRRRANRADLRAWQAALLAQQDPPAQVEELDASMRQRETLLLGLRRRSGVPIHATGLEGRRAFLDRLAAEGLAQVHGEVLRLTPRGWLVSDSIVLQLVAD